MKPIYITPLWHIRFDIVSSTLSKPQYICYLYCGSCPYAYWHPTDKRMAMVTPFIATDIPKRVYSAFKMYNWYKEMNHETYARTRLQETRS